MSYQAYLDTIKAKTGKTPEDFRLLAGEKGLAKYPEIMTWLKSEYGLGQGHANVVAQYIVHYGDEKSGADDSIATHFAGNKAAWRSTYDALLAEVGKFGGDIRLAPTKSYISLTRGGKKFAVVEPATAERFDIGIKLKDAATTERFKAAGNWNIMVTHRVQIHDPKEVDAEVLAWLRQAYDAAK